MKLHTVAELFGETLNTTARHLPDVSSNMLRIRSVAHAHRALHLMTVSGVHHSREQSPTSADVDLPLWRDEARLLGQLGRHWASAPEVIDSTIVLACLGAGAEVSSAYIFIFLVTSAIGDVGLQASLALGGQPPKAHYVLPLPVPTFCNIAAT